MRVPDPAPSLVVAASGALAAVALGSPGAPLVVRAIAAVLLGFVLPGAALTLGLLPRVRLHRAERVALALGSSVATAIGTAFVLHALPSGLNAASWAAALGSVAVAGGILGAVRTRGHRTAAGPWTEGPPVPAVRVLVAPASVAMLAAAGVLMVLAFVVARSGVALGPTAAFSELWLLPLDGGEAVRVGVANHEGGERQYRLLLTVDGRPMTDPVTVRLADGAATDAVLDVPRGRGGPRQVEARLWFADQRDGAKPYRQVDLVVQQQPDAAR